MSFVCFHAYHISAELATDEHPRAVSLRARLSADPKAASRYAELGPADQSLVGLSCLVLGGAPIQPVEPPAKYQQEWSLEAYLTEETPELPALGLSEYLRRSAEFDGKSLGLLQPVSVLHVSFQDVDEYFDVVAASCAPTTLFPYVWRQKADILQLQSQQIDLLVANLTAARCDDKELSAWLSQRYGKVQARLAAVSDEMDCLLLVSQRLGVY